MDTRLGARKKQEAKMFCSPFSKNIQYGEENTNNSTAFIRIKKSVLGYDDLENFKMMVNAVICSRVIVDLSSVKQMTTAAFAQLIVMKSLLRRIGRDLYIEGLRSQPKALCDILKLTNILVS
jgi:hypothetical protein